MVVLTEVQQLQQQVAALTDRIAQLEARSLIQFSLKHPEFESIPLVGETFTIGAVYTVSRSRLRQIERAIQDLRDVSSWSYDSLEIGIC